MNSYLNHSYYLQQTSNNPLETSNIVSYHAYQANLIFQQENLEEIFNNRHTIIKDTRQVKSDIINSTPNQQTIPNIYHNVHFTSPDKPLEIKEENIKGIINNAQKTKSIFPDREYILWTNDQSLIPDTITKLNQAGITIKNFNIEDFGFLNDAFSEAMLNKEFGKASDIARAVLLKVFGGTYLDTDYIMYDKWLHKDLNNMYTLYVGKDSSDKIYFGNAYISAVKDHPVMNAVVHKLERNFIAKDIIHKEGACSPKLDNIPDYIKYPATLFSDVITKTGPTALTVAFYENYNQEGYNDAALDTGIIFSYPGIKNDILVHDVISDGNKESFILLDYTSREQKSSSNPESYYHRTLDNSDTKADLYNEEPQLYTYQERLELNKLVLGNDKYTGSWVSEKFFNTIYYDPC